MYVPLTAVAVLNADPFRSSESSFHKPHSYSEYYNYHERYYPTPCAVRHGRPQSPGQPVSATERLQIRLLAQGPARMFPQRGDSMRCVLALLTLLSIALFAAGIRGSQGRKCEVPIKPH
jgi:hypothetical protein